MASKIVYLVTSGQYSDMKPEAVVTDALVAQQLKATLRDGDVWPFPAIDYVPTKIPEFCVMVRKTDDRWEVVDHKGGPNQVWDFEVAILAPRVEFWFNTGCIRVHHREHSIAREHAEAILAELTGSGPA